MLFPLCTIQLCYYLNLIHTHTPPSPPAAAVSFCCCRSLLTTTANLINSHTRVVLPPPPPPPPLDANWHIVPEGAIILCVEITSGCTLLLLLLLSHCRGVGGLVLGFDCFPWQADVAGADGDAAAAATACGGGDSCSLLSSKLRRVVRNSQRRYFSVSAG